MSPAPLKPPTTYAEWAELLDKLKRKEDDPGVIEAMHRGTIVWQSGVAERFSQKLIDTINARMNAAVDKFQKDMQRTNGHEGAIIQALLFLRKEFGFLYQAINLPVIPEKDRSRYCSLVREQADKAQSSLEDSAKKDRTGKLASIVKKHKVNNF
ncbi:hypothetical protein [Acetivibrio straminisolvens]|jgi:hypothetical protein|uniref:Uncharacterized protein n=1 Tax=Acetivibrio straminisolvens JCM 21531 TaxID=1294263 RepID=W4V3Z1_9FIRM|nr:hypothetical protein [Acetivibrio straminisolvens]GAE87867.1 hypothetical protein JCM21531_1271 [Acetivibrio straminisolvens JCM 21531]